MTGYRLFFSQFLRRYHTTGAILPSGRHLARALCRYLPTDADGPAKHAGASANGTPSMGPCQILEVGPGTGPATAEIVRRLRGCDRLCLVELNEEFVRYLKERFEREAEFQRAADRCQIVHDRLENLPAETRYDFIVSGLPLNNFTLEDVRQLLGAFERLMKPGGVLSFFEYIAIRRAKAALSPAADRERLRGIGRLLEEFLSGRELKCDSIWLNVPPAYVHHVRLGG